MNQIVEKQKFKKPLDYVNDTNKELKRKIKTLEKSLKESQNHNSKLKDRNYNLESDNRVLKLKIESRWAIEFLKFFFSAAFSFGISLFLTEGFNQLLSLLIIIVSAVIYIIVLKINKND
jgi:septal ring factor EnvC (AmiA/AmiB activator)